MKTMGEGQDTFQDSPAHATSGPNSLVLYQKCICTVSKEENSNMGFWVKIVAGS